MSVELIEEIPGQTVRRSARKWRCRCSCGTEFVVQKNSIKSGNTKSCGCYKRKLAADLGKARTTHGQKGSSTHNSWSSMVQRCNNPSYPRYDDYGGRGIRVCDRWRKFENFYADMGDRPKGKTLDRVDNDGDYCPENCRWATPKVQARNRRSSRLITHSGETRAAAEWSEKKDINQKTISSRLHRGWSVERALNTPVRGKR